MKTVQATLTFILFTYITINAQESTYIKSSEIYLSSQSLSGNYGIQFKTSLNKNTFFRLGLFELHVNQTNNLPATTNTFPTHQFTSKGQIQTGIEKRKSISEISYFFYGIDIINETIFNRTKIDNPTVSEHLRKIDDWAFRSGIGIVMGVIINFKNNFYFATEIEPKFLYLYESNQVVYETWKNKKTGFDIHLDSKVVKFSLVYKWNKKGNSNSYQ